MKREDDHGDCSVSLAAVLLAITKMACCRWPEVVTVIVIICYFCCFFVCFFFIVQKQHKTHTVNSWVHWQTWKRHWGILAVQKHNVTEQTNKTRHSTIAMRQNLISDDFSLDLFLLANHAKYTNIYREPAYVMTITLQYSTNECLKKGVSPQFCCCTDAFSTFDLNSWCARIVIPIS